MRKTMKHKTYTIEEKYQIVDILKSKYNIQLLCLILKCSRSGYYSWINLGRPEYKKCDESLVKIILDQYSKDNRQGIKNAPYKQRKGLILHSDQGFHFTGFQYGLLLKNNKIKRSCSYKGSCVDNVPIESFFSALKTECIYLYKNISRELSKILIDNYIKYYNYNRFQEQLKELTPIQYRHQFLDASF